MASKITEAESAPVSGQSPEYCCAAPRPEAVQPLCTESIARRQHHRFTLLLKLTASLPIVVVLPTPLTPTIRIRTAFYLQHSAAHRLSPESRPLFFQQAIEGLGITKLLAGCASVRLVMILRVVSTPTSAINTVLPALQTDHRRFFYRGTG